MHVDDIKRRLNSLSPETPWAHLYEFAPDLFSVTPTNEQFYKKAVGLSRVGDLLVEISEAEIHGHTLAGKRVLDIASGEGAHSIQFAKRGAQVLGIEGRQLYVDRARFAAEALGVTPVQFLQGDVRKIDPSLGQFDVVIASGIIHHLDVQDFDRMMEELGRLTTNLLLIYMHVSTDLSVQSHRLKGPVTTPRGREGHLFREHEDGATADERLKQVRASLDNTFSFWPTEKALIETLQAVGFPLIVKVMSPHVFGWEGASYRPILVAKKRPLR